MRFSAQHPTQPLSPSAATGVKSASWNALWQWPSVPCRVHWGHAVHQAQLVCFKASSHRRLCSARSRPAGSRRPVGEEGRSTTALAPTGPRHLAGCRSEGPGNGLGRRLTEHAVSPADPAGRPQRPLPEDGLLNISRNSTARPVNCFLGNTLSEGGRPPAGRAESLAWTNLPGSRCGLCGCPGGGGAVLTGLRGSAGSVASYRRPQCRREPAVMPLGRPRPCSIMEPCDLRVLGGLVQTPADSRAVRLGGQEGAVGSDPPQRPPHHHPCFCKLHSQREPRGMGAGGDLGFPLLHPHVSPYHSEDVADKRQRCDTGIPLLS